MNCRSCGRPLLSRPVLELPAMPNSAQGFLDDPSDARDLTDICVRQCAACGLVQLDSEPVEYFRSVITSAAWSSEMMAFRQQQARDFVARFSLQGRPVLEVGCASGHFLDLLEAAGAVACGLEQGARGVEEGRSRGRKIIQGYVTEHPPLEPPFSGVVCINFLEHSPRPADFLCAIHGLLEEGGVGLIEVPAFDQAVERVRYYDFVRDHLSYFTSDSLTHIFQATGFEVLRLERVWHGDDLCALVRKRARADFSHWIAANPVVTEFRALVSGVDNTSSQAPSCSPISERSSLGDGALRPSDRFTRIAMWGASHQALTLIAMARPERVRYIVDSSPAKQGRFEPCLGLPIVPPERLHEEPVDLVIVTAAGYSDEVVRQLRDSVQFRGAVAVLRDSRFDLAASVSDIVDTDSLAHSRAGQNPDPRSTSLASRP